MTEPLYIFVRGRGWIPGINDPVIIQMYRYGNYRNPVSVEIVNRRPQVGEYYSGVSRNETHFTKGGEPVLEEFAASYKDFCLEYMKPLGSVLDLYEDRIYVTLIPLNTWNYKVNSNPE